MRYELGDYEWTANRLKVIGREALLKRSREMKSELWGWSAVDLARAISTREISSREAVQASIERIAGLAVVSGALSHHHPSGLGSTAVPVRSGSGE